MDWLRVHNASPVSTDAPRSTRNFVLSAFWSIHPNQVLYIQTFQYLGNSVSTTACLNIGGKKKANVTGVSAITEILTDASDA